MNKINKSWHLENKLPEYLKKYKGQKPQEEIKIIWREAHSKNCNCR